ncbi:Sec-independent protein translocase subunit TatB [Streptomyces sp. NPDC051776]|uniref:Sec-independent protein translocase subunit TatB n=1 Tax=Streptomyces sp. NPDC051776 TaxID=3155414 RepID=UPI00341FD08F
MFADVGPLGLVAMAVLGFLLFGPERLPEAVRKVLGFLRAVREYSDGAKERIRAELGPEFEDFEFEDLNPGAFVRKQLRSGGGRPGLDEIRRALDPTAEMAEIADAVRDVADGRSATAAAAPPPAAAPRPAPAGSEPAEGPARPPFDPDAT